jgi:hypothetical protein
MTSNHPDNKINKIAIPLLFLFIFVNASERRLIYTDSVVEFFYYASGAGCFYWAVVFAHWFHKTRFFKESEKKYLYLDRGDDDEWAD